MKRAPGRIESEKKKCGRLISFNLDGLSLISRCFHQFMTTAFFCQRWARNSFGVVACKSLLASLSTAESFTKPVGFRTTDNRIAQGYTL
jgi:hypothetical protein